MNTVPAVFRLLTCCATAACWTSAAAADPIRVTSGFVEAGFGELGQPWNAEGLYLEGGGLSVGSSLEDERAFVRLTSVPGWPPAAAVDFSGVLRLEDYLGVQLGNSFGVQAVPFVMRFVSSPARLTCATAGPVTDCTGVAAFTLSAELTFIPFGECPSRDSSPAAVESREHCRAWGRTTPARCAISSSRARCLNPLRCH